MTKIKVVMLMTKGDSSTFMYNALKNEFNIIGVFYDIPVSKNIMLKKRFKKIGAFKVFGQVLFISFAKLLEKFFRNKISTLIEQLKLDESEIHDDLVLFNGNLNQHGVSSMINELSPDVIVVNGTRILSSKLLNAVDVPFINTHVGITPIYRGVHGGYWALAENDEQNCGVTVHLVDSGIDTGNILFQDVINVEKSDNFLTYPLKQLHAAIPLMKRAIVDCHSGSPTLIKAEGESNLWYHPTIVEYLYNWITKSVK